MRGVQEINNPTQFNKATKNSRTAFKCFTIRKDKSTKSNRLSHIWFGYNITCATNLPFSGLAPQPYHQRLFSGKFPELPSYLGKQKTNKWQV